MIAEDRGTGTTRAIGNSFSNPVTRDEVKQGGAKNGFDGQRNTGLTRLMFVIAGGFFAVDVERYLLRTEVPVPGSPAADSRDRLTAPQRFTWDLPCMHERPKQAVFQ
jgi:hypothetical protein